jgi:UDP-N-acetylglucosamine 2-epimerase (non-hydrolysing)
MKAAPVVRELRRHPEEFALFVVHTGQHYDPEMSDIFFAELGVEPPEFQLNVGPGSHAQQIAGVLERLEPILVDADLVLVAGDVNSTLGGALAAAAVDVPAGHIESGLRSFDWSMPEERNRVLVDRLSSLLFIHSEEARSNLLAEGLADDSIHFVGNTMIDTLVALLPTIERSTAVADHGLDPGSYLLVTLHRPALVDDEQLLSASLERLADLTGEMPVVFPVHPRTRARMDSQTPQASMRKLRVLPPLGYIEFMNLLVNARAVLTDSGGIQEETTFLGIPCFTLRVNTERPVTTTLGTNTVLGVAPERITEIPAGIRATEEKRARVPELWDGRAAERIVGLLRRPETWERLNRTDPTDETVGVVGR